MIQSIPRSRQFDLERLSSHPMTPVDQHAEWIELRAMQSIHENCPAAVRERLGLDLVVCGQGSCGMARRDGNILLNRALGLGVTRRASSSDLALVQQTYADAGVEKYLVHLHRDLIDITDEELVDAGFEKARAWRKFHRDVRPPPAAPTELEIHELDAADTALVESFARIAADAFDMTSESRPLVSSLARDPRWYLFMSLAGDAPAGTGALFVDVHPESNERVGWLDFGTTAPDFRRRGGQRAVMARRIELAATLGCRLLVTATGEAVGGDPQHSYRNILRAGFVEGRLRENWRPSPLV